MFNTVERSQSPSFSGDCNKRPRKAQTHCLQNFVRLRTVLVTGLMSCSRACMKSSLLTSSFSMADGSISTLLAALMRRFMAVDCAARTSPSSSAPLKFLVITASSFTDIYPFLEVKFENSRPCLLVCCKNYTIYGLGT